MVNIWIGIPFNVTLLYSGLQDIPDELYEAGALDGATGWKAFWHITWPNLRAVVSVVLMLGVIYTLKVLDIILGLTGGGPANATQTIATQSYQRSFVEFKFGAGRRPEQHLDRSSRWCSRSSTCGHPAPDRRVRETTMSDSHPAAVHRPHRHRHRPVGDHAVPAVLDGQRLAPGVREHAERHASSRPPESRRLPAALRDQGRNLVTSMIIAIGTVVLTLLIATPAAYALAQFRFRWVGSALLAILISQMIPGIVIANGLYTHLREHRPAELDPGPDPRQRDVRRSRSRS